MGKTNGRLRLFSKVSLHTHLGSISISDDVLFSYFYAVLFTPSQVEFSICF